MKKIFRAAALITLVGCSLTAARGQRPENAPAPADAQEKSREALWRGLFKAWAYDNDAKKIDVYAENASLTEICFRSQGVTYLYTMGAGCAEPVLSQKMLPPDINRITLEQHDGGPWFVLWCYSQKELSIGCSK